MDSNEVFALSEFDQAVSSGYSGEQPSIHRRPSRQAEHEQEHDPLPRADGGRDAWLFLLGSFFIEALIWGKCCLVRMTTCIWLEFFSARPASAITNGLLAIITCFGNITEQHAPLST